jgi:hypothetical protein
MTKWDHWKNLTINKVFIDDNDQEAMSSYEPFQINKILSMSTLNLNHAVELNCANLPKETHYRYLFNLLPKAFLKVSEQYPKKYNKEDEEHVRKYFEFGTRDLQQAMEILTTEDIRNIRKKYGKLK